MKALIAMSGGVDSSAAAVLMRDAGGCRRRSATVRPSSGPPPCRPAPTSCGWNLTNPSGPSPPDRPWFCMTATSCWAAEPSNKNCPITKNLPCRKAGENKTVEKVQIRRRRRTCADDGDTDREILRQIVCESLCDECAVCRKILSKGIPKRGNTSVRHRRARVLPLLSVSSFSTR